MRSLRRLRPTPVGCGRDRRVGRSRGDGAGAPAGVAVAAASVAGVSAVSPAVATVPAVHQVLKTCCALVVQACPFVIAGGVVSAVVAVFVRPEHWQAIVPAHPVGACVVGVAVGVLVPTCECASVPLARRMMDQGVCPPAAVGFMVAAPSLNPLVLVATAAAFGDGRAAAVRGVAGLVAVVVTVAAVAVGRIGDGGGAGSSRRRGPILAWRSRFCASVG